MSKPSWSWRWESLLSWHLGGRKPRRAASHKHRLLRVESLDARVVLAADLAGTFVPDSLPDEQSVIVAAEQVELSASAGPQTVAARYDLSRDGAVSPIDVLLLVNQQHEAADAMVQAGDMISTLDVNGDGRLSVHDMRQLIGYIVQMNEVHSRYDMSELDASIAGVEHLLSGTAREDYRAAAEQALTSSATHTGTDASLPRAEGEASQELCDDWLVGIYVLEYDIQQAEAALANANENLTEIEDTLAALSPGDFPTYEDYEQFRDGLIGQRDALIDAIADHEQMIDDAYVVLADAQAWYDENCSGTPTPTTPTPTPTTPTPTPTPPTPTPPTPTPPTPPTPTPSPSPTPTPSPSPTPTPTGSCSGPGPVAVNDGPIMVGVTDADLMGNDTGGGELMVVVTLPSHGKLFSENVELVVGSEFTSWYYVPDNTNADEGWHGQDTWSYKLKETCENQTRYSNNANVTINVPEVDMIIYHGQFGAAVDKTKERVTDQLDANGQPVLDADSNRIKLGEGAFTVANMNDTDNDGFPDDSSDDHDANAGHAAVNGRDEVDLIKVVLKKPSFYRSGDTLQFNVGMITMMTGPGSGARIWKDAFRVELESEDPGGLSLTFAAGESERTFWIELITPSIEIGDYQFSYEYTETGFTDYANATAVWAHLEASEFSTKSAGVLSAQSPWDELIGPEMAGPRSGLLSHGGTGLRPIIVDATSDSGVRNVILQQWQVTPPRIWEYPTVQFDLSRRVEYRSWAEQNGTLVGQVQTELFPANNESANDDLGNTDEGGPNVFGHMFVIDSPGRSAAATTNPSNVKVRIRDNFEEFIRVNIGSGIPSGEGIVGSRSSDFYDWHARHSLASEGFQYARKEWGPNDIGPGHCSLTTDDQEC